MPHLGHKEGAFWFYVGLIVLGIVTAVTGRKDPTALMFGNTITGVGTAALLLPPLFRIIRDRLRERVDLSTPQAPLPGTVEDEQGRIISSVTPEWLWGQFVGKTNLQAQKLLEIYIGKWMRVAGQLGDAREIHGRLSVTFQYGRFKTIQSIYMDFSEQRFIDRLAIMRPGEHIDVLGQIERIRKGQLDLVKCELS